MTYTPVGWQDGEAGNTIVNADRLNQMDAGIADADTRLTAAEETVGELDERVTTLENAEPGGGGTDLWTSIYDAMLHGNNTNGGTVDALLSIDDYRVFIFYSSVASGWTGATTATLAVPAGKVLVVLEWRCMPALAADTANRKARLRNTTDSSDVVSDSTIILPPAFLWIGDVGDTPKLTQVGAGKTVRMEAYSSDASLRAAGGLVICKLISV